jgi:hypothetical protein
VGIAHHFAPEPMTQWWALPTLQMAIPVCMRMMVGWVNWRGDFRRGAIHRAQLWQWQSPQTSPQMTQRAR